MSHGQTLDSRAIRSSIKDAQGEFREHLDWSLSGEKYETNTLKITKNGELTVLQTSVKLVRSLHSCSIQIVDSVLVVKSYNHKSKVFLKPTDRPTFVKLFAALLFWQSLRPRGIVNKRLSLNYETSKETESENLLVCNCKIFGQIPKNKNVEVLDGPAAPLFPETNEAWYTAMVVLKSNGILELLGESDGSLLYSIDIKLLSRSEIRELHNSIFESSNYLFVGVIRPLRDENKFLKNSSRDFIPNISKENSKVSRIILEFPYRIDVEDWLVALSAFAKREYVGLDNSNLLRVPRNINIGILEASLNEQLTAISGEFSKVYAEIHIWNTPWVRTSIIESSKNPFFRENFQFELPFTTTKFHLVLKRALGTRYYLDDQILGYSTIESTALNSENFSQETRIPLILKNTEVGQFCVTINNEKNYILPPDNFNNFEQMMLNLDPKKLLRYVMKKQSGSNLEPASVTLLDIFQSLQKENEWFSALIDEEVNKTSLGKKNMNDTSQLYNSLFRGNSILTKSLEIYNLRVGQEYLEKVVGKVITKIISNNRSTEIDPMRVNEPDESLKSDLLEHNLELLLQYSEEIWSRIYNTSNDLPQQIKQQLIQLRKKIEMFTNDSAITLNCITGFLFLRFFCPVILNPKLFFLTKDHQTGEIKRTLTLISKILLTFSNRVLFGAKEPYMMGLNDSFIKKHEAELLDYLDKVTGKKLDFTPKHLKLSSSIERTEIVLTSKTLLKELPTVPYLIDKYLRLDQLVDKISTEYLDPKFIDDYAENDEEFEEDPDATQAELYKIGSLEFEKLVIRGDGDKSKDSQDFEFGSEEFIKNLLHTNESEIVYNYMNSNSSLKDLIVEADRLRAKKSRLAAKLSSSENASDIDGIDSFIDNLLSTTIIDDQKFILKTEKGITGAKYLSSNSSYNTLRLKFQSETDTAPSIAPSARRFSKMLRSASINTISSMGTITTNENGEYVRAEPPKKYGFRKWLKKDK